MQFISHTHTRTHGQVMRHTHQREWVQDSCSMTAGARQRLWQRHAESNGCEDTTPQTGDHSLSGITPHLACAHNIENLHDRITKPQPGALPVGQGRIPGTEQSIKEPLKAKALNNEHFLSFRHSQALRKQLRGQTLFR